jgi:hypothetical protein
MLDGPVTTRRVPTTTTTTTTSLAGGGATPPSHTYAAAAAAATGPCFSHDPLEEAKIHCAIVVFNLGLVSQRAGQQSHCTPNVQATTLQQSKILYFQAYKLLASLEGSSSTTNGGGNGVVLSSLSSLSTSTGNPMLDLLHMAILNNWLQATLDCESFANTTTTTTTTTTTSNSRSNSGQPEPTSSPHWTLQIAARLIRVSQSVRLSSQYGQTTSLTRLCALAEFCLVNASAVRLLPRTLAPAA